MTKRWRLKPQPTDEEVNGLASTLRIDRVLAKLLVQRNIKTYDQARTFFHPELNDLHDPFLMKDMDKAVSRVQQALDNGEGILVYGDYDVDGTTAVAMMYSFLKKFHPKVRTYIPDRNNEGYGVSRKGIDYAQNNKCSLIIALDCGIKADKEIDYAASKGIDIIICDHHRPSDKLPGAVAVLDPKRPDCRYPFKELSGCGVGLKLIQAVCKSKGWDEKAVLAEYLDLAAVSIGADIVPIVDENRILAYYGLKKLNSNPCPGIKAFTIFSKKRFFNISDVIFIIAPRINAAGRINQGMHAVELLTAKNDVVAKEIALEIDNLNGERKELDAQTTEEALEMLKGQTLDDNFCIIVYNPSWHKGVIGIVASRLVEQFYRPAMVFTQTDEDLISASARSMHGFDIYNAIEECQDITEQFGGHKYAAGLTIKKENFESFKKRINEIAKKAILPEMRTPEVEVDAEISMSDITPRFFKTLKKFAPFGPGNNSPVFMVRGLKDNGWGKAVGKENQHLKLTVLSADNPSRTYDAIGFNLGKKIDMIRDGKTFMAVFTIEENEYQGRTNVQIRLKDIKPEGDTLE
ncbi:MAG: single-stranded-DNA-specific exonuclease RecJ [Flavobacteriales bacterium]|nr:MAG: single-stranded-DNA-specific exonuclease RecJ [Flavobacteriales bacterium]